MATQQQGNFDDRDGWIWFDGELGPWRDAKIHVLTHALHYASSVFEGQRAYNGSVFKLREHTERLHQSARILGFEIPWTADEIDAACNAVLKANSWSDAYMRPVAWRGAESMGVAPGNTKPISQLPHGNGANITTHATRKMGLRSTSPRGGGPRHTP